MINLVVVDLAGTAVDDGGAVLSAFRGALGRFSVPFTEEDLQDIRGANKLQAFRQLAARALGSGPETVRVAREAHLAFTEELLHEFRSGPLVPIEGAEAAFAALREQGVKIATNTGFGRDLADAVLTRLGWHHWFAAEVCGDDVPAGRPAPYMIFLAMERAGAIDVRRVAAVGDTPLDLEAGANAGCGAVIGVLTGAGTLASLGGARHTHLLPSIAELPALLGRLRENG